MSCKSAEKKRRIPGPAGLPFWKLKNDEELVENAEQHQNDEELKQDANCMSLSGRILIDKIALESPEFWKGAWLAGCVENNIEVTYDDMSGKLYIINNNNNSFLFSENIKSIRFNKIEHVFKIKELMVLLRTLTVYNDGIGEVIDCFGCMKATFTNKVLSDFIDIRSGSCLILQNITVYQASHHDFYLNVTNNNISLIYPNNTRIPIQLKAVLKQFHKKLGIKSQSQRSITHKKKKNKEKPLRDNHIYSTSKRNKKRRYSDVVDSPWLLSRENKRNIDKHGNDKEDSEEFAILPQKNNAKNHCDEDSDDDVIILSAQNKADPNEDSDDDAIIKDMDMNETLQHPKKKNSDNKEMKPRQILTDNSDKNENPNDENVKKNAGPIPKDVNLTDSLFSQMDGGFYFEDD